MSRFSMPALAICTLATLSMTACANTKEELGLTRRTPDAFAVVPRAPLAMPPTYDLPAPTPGAPRPQEPVPSQNAAKTLFGDVPATDSTTSSAEATLLEQTGATQADPDIRARIASEKDEQGPSNVPVAKRLLNLGKDAPAGVVVDAAAENQRIFDNKQAGRPVTDGETPKAQP